MSERKPYKTDLSDEQWALIEPVIAAWKAEVRITRKTLLELPDPQPPAPPAPQLPDHPAYQQIMAVFAAADAPLRARQVCKAMDLEIAPNNINNTRLKLKRLTERGILVETEQGLFTQPRP